MLDHCPSCQARLWYNKREPPAVVPCPACGWEGNPIEDSAREPSKSGWELWEEEQEYKKSVIIPGKGGGQGGKRRKKKKFWDWRRSGGM